MLRLWSAKVRARWASLNARQVARACVCLSALGVAGATGLALAQNEASEPASAPASVPADSGASAASTTSPGSSASAASAPDFDPTRLGKLSLDQQVKWLRNAAQTGALEQMDDAQLLAVFQWLDPLAMPRYIQDGPNGYPSYEFTMLRQERMHGSWPSRRDHMLVRLTREPLRIYVKWLPDGPHSGQEIIYDESKRYDEMYGHLGGLLNILPLWTSINGTLARAQSKHQVRDLGTEFIARQFLDEGRKFAEAGIRRPTQIEVKTLDGVRVVAFTYETATGQPEFYAKKEVLGLDLRHPYFRSVESYDNDGKIFERIVFETITPKTFDDMAFDPKNPAYKF